MVSRNQNTQCRKTRNSLSFHWKKISWNQLLSKTVDFTNFFHKFPWSPRTLVCWFHGILAKYSWNQLFSKTVDFTNFFTNFRDFHALLCWFHGISAKNSWNQRFSKTVDFTNFFTNFCDFHARVCWFRGISAKNDAKFSHCVHIPCCGLVLRLVLFSICSWARLCLWLRFKLRSALLDPRWLELSVEVLSLVVSRIVRGSEDSLREGQEVDNLWLFDFWLELISRLAWALLIRISWMRSWIREICKILSSEKW